MGPKGGVSGHKDVNGETNLLDAVTTVGPVSVAIQADQASFQNYASGVLTGTCGTQLDHGVLAVGFGTEGSTKYWKVKNSWGSSWGANGYVLIERGSNKCGIASEPSYPTVSAEVATPYASEWAEFQEVQGEHWQACVPLRAAAGRLLQGKQRLRRRSHGCWLRVPGYRECRLRRLIRIHRQGRQLQDQLLHRHPKRRRQWPQGCQRRDQPPRCRHHCWPSLRGHPGGPGFISELCQRCAHRHLRHPARPRRVGRWIWH